MIWAILAALGVPLWVCAGAISVLVYRNRSMRKRPGNVPVRVHAPNGRRWVAGHGLWVSDVFAFRGSPAAWKEALMQVTSATAREPTADERKPLHRIGDEPVVALLTLAGGSTVAVAVRAGDEAKLLGPFAPADPEDVPGATISRYPHNGAAAMSPLDPGPKGRTP
jgi:hypothetical protein